MSQRHYNYKKNYPHLSEEATKRKRERSRIRLAEWRKNNPDLYKEQRKRWYEKNKERLRVYAKEHRDRNKDMYQVFSRRTLLKQCYGITEDQYQSLLESQGNRCKICKGELVDRKLTHLDHCHATNKIRGILCRGCNHGLGHFRDNPVFLKSAIKYLLESE